MNANIIFLAWMIVGLINLIILFIVQKKFPEAFYNANILSRNLLYQVGVLLIWFTFAFIIIPLILIRFLARYLNVKANQLLEKIEEVKKKNKRL